MEFSGSGSESPRLIDCSTKWQNIGKEFLDLHSFLEAGNIRLLKASKWTKVKLWHAKGCPSLILKSYKMRCPYFPFLKKMRFVPIPRVFRAWDAGIVLAAMGVPLAEQLALVRLSIMEIVIVMFYIEGQPLMDWRPDHVDDEDLILEKIGETVAKMHKAGIVHGDLKWSNIILHDGGKGLEPYFIDLDGAKFLKSMQCKSSKKLRAQDIARFIVGGIESDVSLDLLISFIIGYASIANDVHELIKPVVSRMRILFGRKQLEGVQEATEKLELVMRGL